MIRIELQESVIKIEEVDVRPPANKAEPVNDLSLLSSRSFSSVETENFPGAITDISRAALSFPGVICGNDGQNHMIIRGNSPKGLQWRLEGICLGRGQWDAAPWNAGGRAQLCLPHQ